MGLNFKMSHRDSLSIPGVYHQGHITHQPLAADGTYKHYHPAILERHLNDTDGTLSGQMETSQSKESRYRLISAGAVRTYPETSDDCCIAV